MFLNDVVAEIDRIMRLNNLNFNYKIHLKIHRDKNGNFIDCKKYLVVTEDEDGHEIFCQEPAEYIDMQFETSKDKIQETLSSYGWKVN